MATFFLLLAEKKEGKEKGPPVKSLIFALFQFSLRQFSELAASGSQTFTFERCFSNGPKGERSE